MMAPARTCRLGHSAFTFRPPTAWLGLFLGLLALLGGGTARGDALQVRFGVPGFDDTLSRYERSLLELTLTKTIAREGPFELTEFDARRASGAAITASRSIELLRAGQDIDVLVLTSTTEREAALLPIRIPIDRGLLGYRVLLIRSEDAPRFAQLKSLRDISLGQVADWLDTRILERGGLTVVTGPTQGQMMGMLHAGRFDAYPRGLPQAWDELATDGGSGLMIEPTLAIYYPLARYFFVAPGNHALADRIERGFRLAIADGSFATLFHDDPGNKRALALADLKHRRIIRLNNPFLPRDAPRDESGLWFEPLAE